MPIAEQQVSEQWKKRKINKNTHRKVPLRGRNDKRRTARFRKKIRR
jgi:hypothetical protein